MYDDIINILNLNHSDVQSCTSKKENNRITYYITLIRKEFFVLFAFINSISRIIAALSSIIRLSDALILASFIESVVTTVVGVNLIIMKTILLFLQNVLLSLISLKFK